MKNDQLSAAVSPFENPGVIQKINFIQIEKINYFGYNETGSYKWNAKVIYKKYGRSFHALIDIDFISKDFFINKDIQFKECKVLTGLIEALRLLNYFKL